MDFDNILSSVFNELAHCTTKLDKNLHNNKPDLKNSFIDNFIHELEDFLYVRREIHRLNQMSEDTLFEICSDTSDYFTTIVDFNTPNLPKLDGVRDNIFYIPKELCDLSVNSSLYKSEDIIQEEMHYKNYLQLKNGIYKVVDKDGNILQ